MEPTFDDKGSVVLYAPSCPIANVDNNKKDLIMRLFASFDKQGLRTSVYLHRNTPAPVIVRGTNYDMFPVIRARVPSDTELSAELHLLGARLEQMKPYEPLSLSEAGHVPSDRKQRAHWISKLRATPICSTPLVLFYYHQGGSLPMLYWAWRCDTMVEHCAHLPADQQETKKRNEHTIAELVAEVPRIATRRELKDLRETVERVAAVPHSKRRLKETLMMVAGGTSKGATAITPHNSSEFDKYTCGAPLFHTESEHPLSSRLVVRVNLGCFTPQLQEVYAADTVQTCAHCGERCWLCPSGDSHPDL